MTISAVGTAHIRALETGGVQSERSMTNVPVVAYASVDSNRADRHDAAGSNPDRPTGAAGLMGILDRLRRPAPQPTAQSSAKTPVTAAPSPAPTVRETGAESPAPDLERLAGGADRIAVVDCETTGLYNTDRIVELAIVTVALDGTIAERWETVVQPGRDVGATHIHGLTAEALAGAPTFADVAGDVALRLHGACIAAHNLPFDARMVSGEFSRLDTELILTAGIDTLQATRARLSDACGAYGVPLVNAHSAAADASATAALLLRVAALCEPGAPAAAPVNLWRTGKVRRRSDLGWIAVPDPPYIALLAAALDHAGLEASMVAYLELVERAVADLHLDADERSQLAVFAADLGLSDAQRAQAHRRFVNDLVDAALADGIVTDDELDMLLRVASSLAVATSRVTDRTRSATTTAIAVTLTPGLTVAFTGDDPHHPREMLIAHAAALGLTPATNVTKTTDLLVAADPASTSGKAAKARNYGLPIVSSTAFFAATAGVQLEAAGASVEARKVITCPDCHTTWTVSAGSSAQKSKRCDQCASAAATPRGTRQSASAERQAPAFEELTCTTCGQTWTRQRIRGRKPLHCPECANTAS